MQMFLTKARTFRLQHLHILPILDFGINSDDRVPFIVMEFAPNGTLRSQHPPARSNLERIKKLINVKDRNKS